ncbi:MAG: shikimate dehydrogenase family protein [Fimbriimonas sp.]
MTLARHWRDAEPADYAVIGDPVHHSLSPTMHMAAYRELGLDLRYVAVHVPEGELESALSHLESLGYHGVNATIPHKSAAAAWAQVRSPLVERAQVANTLRFRDRASLNTDGPGFMDTLSDLGVTSGRVLVLGAGGSARALFVVLAEAGYEISAFNRTRARLTSLLTEVQVNATVLDAPSLDGFDLILNTTASSLQGENLDLPWSEARPDALAYDLMYSAEPTPFLRSAAAHGLQTTDGLGMLVAQGARALEWWLGVPAPRDVMRRAIQ